MVSVCCVRISVVYECSMFVAYECRLCMDVEFVATDILVTSVYCV